MTGKNVQFKAEAELEQVRSIDCSLKPGITPKKPGQSKKSPGKDTPKPSTFSGFGKRAKPGTEENAAGSTPEMAGFSGFGSKRKKRLKEDPENEETKQEEGPVKLNDTTITQLLTRFQNEASIAEKQRGVFAFYEALMKSYNVCTKSDDVFARFLAFVGCCLTHDELEGIIMSATVNKLYLVPYYEKAEIESETSELKQAPSDETSNNLKEVTSGPSRETSDCSEKLDIPTKSDSFVKTERKISQECINLHKLLALMHEHNGEMLFPLLKAARPPVVNPELIGERKAGFVQHLLHASSNYLCNKRKEIILRVIDDISNIEYGAMKNLDSPIGKILEVSMNLLLQQIKQTVTYTTQNTTKAPIDEVRTSQNDSKINVGEAKKLFSIYCRVLETYLLKMPTCIFAPFLVVCSSSLHGSLIEHLVSILWRTFENDGNQLSATWLGCLLSRFNFIPLPLVKDVLRYFSVWLSKAVDEGKMTKSKLRLFNSATQAFLMIFVVYHDKFCESKKDKAFIKSLRFGKILMSNQKPLNFICLKISYTFLSLCESLDLVSSVSALKLTIASSKDGTDIAKRMKLPKLFSSYPLSQSKWAIEKLMMEENSVKWIERFPRKRGFSEMTGGETDEELEVYKSSICSTNTDDEEHEESML